MTRPEASSRVRSQQLEMPLKAAVQFEADLTLEQQGNAGRAIRCVIQQPRRGLNIITDGTKHAIARTAQKTTHQISRVIMIDLSSITFPTCCAFAILSLQKRIELFDGNAVAKPQVTPPQRTKLLQCVFDRSRCSATGAIRALVISTRPSTSRAPRFLWNICFRATATTKAHPFVALHKKAFALGARGFLFRCSRMFGTAFTAAKQFAPILTRPKIHDGLAAVQARMKLTALTTETSESARTGKRFAASSALSRRSHPLSLFRGADNYAAIVGTHTGATS